jgi:glucose-6-phosphate-specific signal transduction histidine kinase
VYFDFAIKLLIKCFKLLISVGNMKTWQYCNSLVLFLVKVLFAFKFGWASSLFTVMSVFFVITVKNYFHEDLTFSHFFWCSLGLICYFIFFKLSKLIVYIFEFFQSVELIKHVITPFNIFTHTDIYIYIKE